jgi:hypothetical protein
MKHTHTNRNVGFFIFSVFAFVGALASFNGSNDINTAAASNLDEIGVEVSYVWENDTLEKGKL